MNHRHVQRLVIASSLAIAFASCGPSSNATQAETPAPSAQPATPPAPTPALAVEPAAAPVQVAAATPTPPTPPSTPAARGATGAAPAAAGRAGAAPAMEVLEFKPLFDDLMTMLIQPRHIKLWAAAQQQNWTLAAFELNELRTAFDRIAATIPKYGPQNVNLGPTFISMMSGPIMAINGAISAKSLPQFNTAYLDLTNTCTSCHQALNHPFLVIKVPDASALTNFANQDFKPAAEVK